MAMIEINIHIPIDGVNNISIPIYLPVVPRVGEKIYLSDNQINNLITGNNYKKKISVLGLIENLFFFMVE